MVERLRSVLAALKDPKSGRPLPESGLLDGLSVRDGEVSALILATRETAPALESLRVQAEQLLAAQPGVRSAKVLLTGTAQSRPSLPPKHDHDHAGHSHANHGPAGAPGQGAGQAGGRAKLLPDVGAIIAVASGKGGVGKSTTAVNLAVALAREGLRTGLLDADIFGPSLPIMLGTHRKPQVVDGMMIPLQAWGLKAMSIGFLVDAEQAMVWRGPMVMGALEQMMGQVEWGALDVLVVDMPPGTGDAQLTMAQRVSLAGAVIVSTPQDIALADARRGVNMFAKTHVPVLGIIENMSYFNCPHCGERSDVFGHGGARAEAAKLGVEFLGEIPLLLQIRETSDAGKPIVAAAPDSDAARPYIEIARKLAAKLAGKPASSGPRIIMD